MRAYRWPNAQRVPEFGDWDLASDIVYVSPEYRELYGLAPDVPLTYDLWLNHLVHPKTVNESINMVVRFLTRNQIIE
jgi:hypothetical protein